MVELLKYYWWALLLALIFGVATGYWIWAQYKAAKRTMSGTATGALGAVGGLATGMAGSALNAAKAAADTAVDATKSVAGTVSDVAHSAVDTASHAAAKVGDVASDAAHSALDATKSVAGTVADAAQGAVSSASDMGSSALSGAAALGGAAVAAAGTGAAAVAGLVKPKIAAAVGAPDDLLQIKGIGPKLNALCHSLGVSRFDQIAHWGDADIAEVDQHLGTFRGRIVRDGWIEQAKLLAAGDVAAFEAKFGKLDSENK